MCSQHKLFLVKVNLFDLAASTCFSFLERIGRRLFVNFEQDSTKGANLLQWGLVSKETVVLRRCGSDTRKFGLSTELIM